MAGIESTDEGHVDSLRTVHASEWRISRHIRLPTAVPYLFAGLELAITVSDRAIVGGARGARPTVSVAETNL